MIVTLLVLAAAYSQADLDVLAQSRAGRMLCSNPDAATKSCSAISAYRVSEDGTVIETSELLIAPGQPLTLTMSIEAQIDGNSVCGVMTMDDLRRAQIRLDGEALPPDRNANVLERLEPQLASVAGKRACETIRIEDGTLVKSGHVEGIDLRPPGKPVMWISELDGYKVAPR